jgi:WD40 repeat protein
VSFIRDIAPILQRHCVACHGEGKAEGEWRADSLAALTQEGASGADSFLAGNRAESEAFVRITSTDADLRMPLDGEPLSTLDIDAIGRWIDAGLPFDGVSADILLVDEMPPPVHPAAPPSYATLPQVTALTFTPSGDLLVGGWREVLVIDPVSGGVRSRIGNLPERSSRIAVHPAGDRFAVAGGVPGRLGEVRLFTLSGDLLRVLAPGADIVHDVAWSPGGDRIAVASSDATVRIFDAESGSLVRTIPGHRDWVLAVAWSPDGSRIATGSRDRTAKVFDAATGTLLATYGRHDAPVRGILFHPEGEEMISASDAQKWDRWKIAAAAHVRDTHLGGEVFQLVAAGEFFAAPSAQGKVHLFKLQDGEKVREYETGTAARLISVAASVAADLVAAGTQDGRVVVWKLSTAERLAEFPLQP